MERNLLGWVEGKCYRKTSDFRSNGNSVLYHPTRKELAEVTRGYRLGDLEKVRDLRPER
ncbi:MAG: hypothetical protein KKB79_02075 [Nanoarchaeota archaeon]|nr:hypothetical protein [Nanoarchaeota archaeon]